MRHPRNPEAIKALYQALSSGYRTPREERVIAKWLAYLLDNQPPALPGRGAEIKPETSDEAALAA
ncbi:MAG TPA: hypothetical protein PK264_01925 [Hyphomicrobiaceae bacterium]|nr:hypothetical protein [Hyphomicrobiaceae bacterium]